MESPSASERIETARAFIEDQPPGTEVLIVGPFREAADELARLIAIRRGATVGLHRFSLVELAARMALTEADADRTVPVSPLGAQAVAARVSFQAAADGVLDYFTPVSGFPGFPRALARTLDELRLAGAAPRLLETVARGDVTNLFRRFEEQLAEGRLHDLAGLLDAAAKASSADPPPRLLAVPLVLLDVAVHSPAHAAFVRALAARAPSVLATVPAGDEETARVFRALARGPQDVTPAPERRAPDRSGDEVDRLRIFLFSPEAPPESARTGRVVLFSAPGEGRECVEIARLVLDEARGGTPFDQMAVLLRGPAGYSPLLRAALARAGIPAYFAQGTTRPDPAGRAFLTLIDCALEGFSARRFSEYLAFAQVPGARPQGETPSGEPDWTPPEDDSFGPAARARADAALGNTEERAAGDRPDPAAADADDLAVLDGDLRTPWKWEELVVESAVIGGLDRWRRRLDGLAEEFRLRVRALERDSPGSPQVQAVERDLQNLGHLRGFALPVIERLAALPERAAWGEWIPALEALAPIVLRSPERVLAVLAELRPLGPVGGVGLAEVRSVLAPHLTALEEPRPPQRYGRLFVGTLEQSRGRAFDVVFVPGLAERVVPQKPREDPILLDEARRAFVPQLPTQDRRADHERLLLRLAVGGARKRVYLSYPRVDVEAGRSRVASFYALEVYRALTGTIPDPETLEREAAEAVRARLAWPAPEVPTYAIDDIEYDLATLRVLFVAGPENPSAAAGRARYLLDLNDCLGRSLRARWQRWSKSWTPADGLVRATEATRGILQAARPNARGYSVGALERYSQCPYRFYLSAIYRLEPREETAPLQELDPLTRGALFHDVQADVMRALRERGSLPLSPAGAPAAMRVLDETLARVAEEYRERLAPAIPRVWQTAIESLRIDLRMWLERCVEAHAAWDPVAFELAFGTSAVRPEDVDPLSLSEEVVLEGGFRLRGVADLVERRRGAQELRVTDYKTGRASAPRHLVVGGGGVLQPVLYALAAEQIFGAPVAESRLFYCTRAGQFQERVVRIAGTDAPARGRDVLDAIDRAVSSGFLPAAPQAGACGICDFRDVCGPHEELRTSRKQPGPIEGLRAMRQLR